jgi:SAM-dependent methyltransferase
MSSPLANPVPWNLVADAYEREVMPMFEKFATDALELAAPAPGTRVVDVACGPGTLSVLAARRGLTVDALDFSPEMIARLETRVRELGAAITPRLGDGQALPYDSATYAAGFSMFGLMFFPDRAKGFAELRRVLAPGARAVVSSWHPMEGVPVMMAMMTALRPAFAEMMKGQAPPPSTPPLVTEDACRTEMSAAFADVQVHSITHVQIAPNANELFDSIARTMAPVVLLRRTIGEERWAAHEDGARRAVREVAGDGPVEVKLPAWLTVGTAR